MANNLIWKDWQAFREDQKETILDAGTAAHIPVSIRYIDIGEDINGTILLMHGIPTWGFLFHETIPLLMKAGFRVIAPDFLGHGWSDRRDRFDRSFQTQASVILALLATLGIRKTHVVGHDTGGAVALILAIEHPHIVERVILSNAVCYDRFDDDMLGFGHPIKWKAQPVDALVSVLNETLQDGLHNQERLTSMFRDGIIAPWASEEGKLSLIRNAAALNANQTMALVDRHGTITAPTLVLWGMKDPWQPSSDGLRLTTEIPGSLFQNIDSASHWVPQDEPKRFASAIIEFLGT